MQICHHQKHIGDIACYLENDVVVECWDLFGAAALLQYHPLYGSSEVRGVVCSSWSPLAAAASERTVSLLRALLACRRHIIINNPHQQQLHVFPTGREPREVREWPPDCCCTSSAHTYHRRAAMRRSMQSGPALSKRRCCTFSLGTNLNFPGKRPLKRDALRCVCVAFLKVAGSVLFGHKQNVHSYSEHPTEKCSRHEGTVRPHGKMERFGDAREMFNAYADSRLWSLYEETGQWSLAGVLWNIRHKPMDGLVVAV